MAHRTMKDGKIENLQQWLTQQVAMGKSPTTYCSRGEYRDFVEDHGELVMILKNGDQIRKGAHLKVECRGGSPSIRWNRVIIGHGPTATHPHGYWTFYPADWLDKLVERHRAEAI